MDKNKLNEIVQITIFAAVIISFILLANTI